MYTTQTNDITFERFKNFATAAQNLREEAARLQDVINQEAKPGGTDDAEFVDTPIATKAELLVMMSYLTDFRQFNDGDGSGELAVARWGWLVPFINQSPA
jgi:hypothetical protein